MFNEIHMVETYLKGEKIPKRAIDDCIFQLSKYYKEHGLSKIETKIKILEWLDNNNLYFVDINNNIDNAYNTKSKLVENFSVRINKKDIDAINFAADFPTAKKVALFLLVYAKIHSDYDGNFKIRIATMSEWIGIKRENLYSRYISQLSEYGFIEVDHGSYRKYLNRKKEEKRMCMKINHELKNEGEYIIEKNEDFNKLFKEIFG